MMPNWLDTQKVLEFVWDRYKENGGFAMTPLLPATLEDTYLAVKILRLLKVPLPKETRNYILGLKWEDHSMPKNLYQLARLYKVIKIDIPKSRLLQPIKSLAQSHLGLEHYSYLLRITKLCRLDNIKAKICSALSISPKNWQVLKELYFYWYIARICKLNLSPQNILWIRQCQNGDGGFGFMPHTTSFLENTYYALTMLSFFKKMPLRPDLCLKFIRCCYIPNKGAFARSPGGVVFLESTYYGLAALSLLDPI